MLTTRMSPKMSEKPLATMNSSPANVSPSSSVREKRAGSSIAEPKFVVRQFPPNVGRRVGEHEDVEEREHDGRARRRRTSGSGRAEP